MLITIKEPEGIDRLAYQAIQEYIKKNQISFWSFGERKVMEEFMLLFGDTIYGAHVALRLGRTAMGQGKYERALSYLSQAAENLDFVGGKEALTYLIRIYQKMGVDEKVKYYQEQRTIRYPESKNN